MKHQRASEAPEERESRLEQMRIAAAAYEAADKRRSRRIGWNKCELRQRPLGLVKMRSSGKSDEEMRVAEVTSRFGENEQWEIRLERVRIAVTTSRAVQNEEQWEIRLEEMQASASVSRAVENEDQLKQMQNAAVASRAAENEE